MTDHLIAPHGGALVNLMVDHERAMELKATSRDWPSYDLTARQLCDLELLFNGGLSPLRGFMTRCDYEDVCQSMRLSDGVLWPVPVTLDVPEALAKSLKPGSILTLRDEEGVMLAALHVEDVWQPNRATEAEAVFGSANPEHPGVQHLLERTKPFYVGGRLEGLQQVSHYDYRQLRHTPAELRTEFSKLGWQQVVAFQTRNPMHRAHQELTLQAAKEAEANLLIHPVVGMTKPGDVDHYTRVRCYQVLIGRYPKKTAMLSLLPLAMRMGGPREAVWHAIIRKNHGCTHLIVGRDHAGPGSDSTGTPFYGPYDAQDLLRTQEQELGVKMVPFKMMVYVEELDSYVADDQVSSGTRALSISGTELRRRLAEGREIPGWFTFSDVADELRRSHPPRYRQGFTVLFTGLSGSGKSTIANVLLVKIPRNGRAAGHTSGRRPRSQASLLGARLFQRASGYQHQEDRLRRFGDHEERWDRPLRAPIAPYDAVRKEVRAMIEPLGGFFLVHVAAPLEVCEQRDRKGLYAKARAGIIKEFTGVSDPYEEPADADLVIDTTDLTPEEAAQQIILHLEREGYVGAEE